MRTLKSFSPKEVGGLDLCLYIKNVLTLFAEKRFRSKYGSKKWSVPMEQYPLINDTCHLYLLTPVDIFVDALNVS